MTITKVVQGEILPYFKYDVTALSEKAWGKDTVKHFKMLGKLQKALNSTTAPQIFSLALYNELILNDYGFQIIVENDYPYNVPVNCSLVKLTLNYCSSKPIYMYMDNDILADHKAACKQFSIYKPYFKEVTR